MAKIMIVDDSLLIRVSLKKLFEKQGHQVVAEAPNGQAAVEQYQRLDEPDLGDRWTSPCQCWTASARLSRSACLTARRASS